jgi:hypothetical protein
MPRFDAFLGPTNASISPNLTSELTMNWIPERNPVSVEGQGTDVHDKNVRCSLIRRPGLQTFVTLPNVPVRGVFAGENRLFAVGGDHFYEITREGYVIDRSTAGFTAPAPYNVPPWSATGAGTAGGTIGIETAPVPVRPVQCFLSGNQILLVSAGHAYCDNGNGPVVCRQSIPLNDLVVDPAPAGGLNLTDLQLGGNSMIVLSPSHYFTSDDVGQPLTITAGTGFTPGNYTVNALLYGNTGQPTGAALLNAGAGTAGSTGGTGTLGYGGTAGYVLTTATGGSFDSTDVGRTIQITGGTGFFGVTQPVIQVTSNGGAVGSSQWGSPGASLGTGVEYLDTYSLTDLKIGALTNLISSASYKFTATDVGQSINITSGTGFTPGSYTITSLQISGGGYPSGNAYLDRAAGTAGSTGGHGTVGTNQLTASSGAFMDGYFFAVESSPTNNSPTKTVNFSALDVDGGALFWNPLDYFVKHAYPDNVAMLWADHEELYTFGDMQSTQVWRDTGNADNPFQPDPGAIMHIGCQAPFSVVRLGNGVAWIGEDVLRGTRKAYLATGYNPTPISTPAVEAQWAKMSSVADAVAFTYADQGHELWVITFPTGDATWVYDLSTGWWHQWGWWNPGINNWNQIRTWVHCVVALGSAIDKHYGGDNSTGQIYVMSSQFKTDDGNLMMRRRRAPHLTNENMRRFYSRFEIDCDRLGMQRVFWNRLGNGRDRIWQMDTSQASETASVVLTVGWSDDRTQSFQLAYSQTVDPSVDVMLSNAYLNWVDATWH